MVSGSNQSWYVYILQCSDNSLYTGCTKDLERRIAQHLSKKGAKYTRGRLPLTLVYREMQANYSQALRREIAIKKMSVEQKKKLISSKHTL